MEGIKIEGDPDLVRDPQTNAVINSNSTAYVQYMQQKEKRRKQELEIQELKDEIGEIKSLLKTLINKS